MPAKSATTTKTTAKKRPNRSKRAADAKPSLAARADRHECYQQSVQCVEAEIDFIDETFKELRGRRAITLREDFAGTANSSCEWVKRHNKAVAHAVDLDPDPVNWGKDNNVAKLTPSQQQRVSQIIADVRTARTPKADALLAMNFSWMIFQTRDTLRDYFKAARKNLSTDGLLFLDLYGGWESFKEMRDKRKINKNLTYVWDQHRYNPITGEMHCFIHFHFSDGSKINRAFAYTWRLWTLPEVRELLAEAGFSRSTVYWEGTDDDGEGSGEYEPTDTGDADPAWVSYIVAEP